MIHLLITTVNKYKNPVSDKKERFLGIIRLTASGAGGW